jgi:hypothetical protein
MALAVGEVSLDPAPGRDRGILLQNPSCMHPAFCAETGKPLPEFGKPGKPNAVSPGSAKFAHNCRLEVSLVSRPPRMECCGKPRELLERKAKR